jgi:hypothetical protein
LTTPSQIIPVPGKDLTKSSAPNATSGKRGALAIDTKEIPLSREKRIGELRELPNKMKENFLPPVGLEFQIGPYVYKVSIQNVGDMRFTAKLHDVVIEGFNDGL